MSEEDPKRWDLTTKVKALVCCCCCCSLTLKLLSFSLVSLSSLSFSARDYHHPLTFFSLLFSLSRSSRCVITQLQLQTDWWVLGPPFVLPDDWIHRIEKSLRFRGGFAGEDGTFIQNAHDRSRRGFVQANQLRVGYSGGDETKENRGYFFFEECQRYVLEVARVSERKRQDVVEVGQKSE